MSVNSTDIVFIFDELLAKGLKPELLKLFQAQ